MQSVRCGLAAAFRAPECQASDPVDSRSHLESLVLLALLPRPTKVDEAMTTLLVFDSEISRRNVAHSMTADAILIKLLSNY